MYVVHTTIVVANNKTSEYHSLKSNYRDVPHVSGQTKLAGCQYTSMVSKGVRSLGVRGSAYSGGLVVGRRYRVARVGGMPEKAEWRAMGTRGEEWLWKRCVDGDQALMGRRRYMP